MVHAKSNGKIGMIDFYIENQCKLECVEKREYTV